MKNSPLVSVLVASYNNAKYIISTLDSIYNQTYKHLELIIVDDHSTDESVNVIQNWINAHKDLAITLVKNERNLGISKTFSRLFALAKGEFITTIGSDDNFLPFKIEKFLTLFSKLDDNYAVVFSDAFLINSDGNRRYGRFIQCYRQFEQVPSGNLYRALLVGNFIPAMATMIKASMLKHIDDIDETLAYEDYDLWLKLAQKFKFYYCDEETVEYRIHSNSITFKKNPRWLESTFQIYLKHIDQEISRQNMIAILREIYLNDPKNSFPYIRKFYKETGIKCNEYYFSKFKLSPKLFQVSWALKQLFK